MNVCSRTQYECAHVSMCVTSVSVIIRPAGQVCVCV